MRVMDGLMSIPAILLAIALTAVTTASTSTVIFAITVVALPRVVRLVRSVVLTVREQAFVEAAVDRKSVVEGKGVSVRVELGGRRTIKKKHTNTQNREVYTTITS